MEPVSPYCVRMEQKLFMQILSDEGYSVVMVERGCAISTCHDEAGIQANVRQGVYCGDS